VLRLVSLQVLPGDTTLSLLPPWHIYQRTVSYYLLSVGCQEVFSSIRSFAKDLTAYPPDHFICVPLVLDTLYNKVGHTHSQGSCSRQVPEYLSEAVGHVTRCISV